MSKDKIVEHHSHSTQGHSAHTEHHGKR